MAARKKVNIMELLDYIEQLPADSQIKKDLTEDKMIRIKRYLEELKYIETVIKQLKADIKKNGAIELYKNGTQETRRTNPALTSYMDAMKTYNQLLKQVSEILRNTEIYIQKLW
ncbi:hypothetical protein IAI10_02590 [Clostridium sp. 19966]|uniref:hypothetical protein n=1 Tax=Clostridium sp. 19966 TaxID=2768166 RepID=UPI0028E043C6|nr:hypothetical protein [Clostridium sp. 19966]MDT8715547.1 hypothetical protein [Clostridium sp. 19966]